MSIDTNDLIERFSYRLVEARERAVSRVASLTHTIDGAIAVYKVEVEDLVREELAAVMIEALMPELRKMLETMFRR